LSSPFSPCAGRGPRAADNGYGPIHRVGQLLELVSLTEAELEREIPFPDSLHLFFDPVEGPGQSQGGEEGKEEGCDGPHCRDPKHSGQQQIENVPHRNVPLDVGSTDLPAAVECKANGRQNQSSHGDDQDPADQAHLKRPFNGNIQSL